MMLHSNPTTSTRIGSVDLYREKADLRAMAAWFRSNGFCPQYQRGSSGCFVRAFYMSCEGDAAPTANLISDALSTRKSPKSVCFPSDLQSVGYDYDPTGEKAALLCERRIAADLASEAQLSGSALPETTRVPKRRGDEMKANQSTNGLHEGAKT